MKRVCITINLKRNLQKNTSKEFEYYIEEHLNNQNFEGIISKLIKDEIKFIYMEEICFLRLHNKQEIVEFFLSNKMKLIILYMNNIQIDKKEYNLNTIDIVNDDFNKKVEQCETIKAPKKAKKRTNNSHLQFGDNVIIGISLDRKVYSTTYLLNLLKTYENKNLLYVEKKQSLIEYFNIINSDELKIDYKIIKTLRETQLIKYEKYDKVIVDLGYIYNIKSIQKLLKNLTLPIIVFQTNCYKVWENDEYIKIIRLLEKYNNVIFISREEIFDKMIQDTLNPFKSKIIKKHIKRNKLGRFNV